MGGYLSNGKKSHLKIKTPSVIDIMTVINPYKVGYDTFAQKVIKIKVDAHPEKFVNTLNLLNGSQELPW